MRLCVLLFLSDRSPPQRVVACWPRRLPGQEPACCLRELGPGDACGAAALALPGRHAYAASLVAESACEVLDLGREQLLGLEVSPRFFHTAR